MNRAVAVARLRIVIACLGVLGLAGEAFADWAVVTVGGDDIKPATRELVRGQAEERLRAAEYNTLDKGSAVQVGVTDEAIGRCVQASDACVKKALAAAEVDRLVHIELLSVSPGYRVTARFYDGIRGSLLRKEERRCSECEDRDALGRAIDDLVSKLIDGKGDTGPAVSGPDTWLEVSADPPGATVKIDGKDVGPSGRAYSVSAGEHRVRVELEGYDPAEKMVTAATSETTGVMFTLSKHVEVPPGPRRFGAWRWATLGAGAGLTVAGVILVAMDGPQIDGNGDVRPREYHTMGPGVSAVATGVCLIGLSAFFFHHDATLPATGHSPKTVSSKRTQGITIQRLRDGWGLGMSGSF